jgi:hypothetical protein
MATRTCATCSKSVALPDDPKVVALCDAAGAPLCETCFDDWRAKADVNRPPEPVVEQIPTRYLWTPDMGEISGFGGGYEQTCRNMVASGMAWLDAHPDADPKFRGYKGVYGVLSDDNVDAKALSEAVVAGSGGDCTGAMHQATVSACLFIRTNGWDRYCEEMRRR